MRRPVVSGRPAMRVATSGCPEGHEVGDHVPGVAEQGERPARDGRDELDDEERGHEGEGDPQAPAVRGTRVGVPVASTHEPPPPIVGMPVAARRPVAGAADPSALGADATRRAGGPRHTVRSMAGSDATAAERRVLDAIDEEELVATLVELVRVPSVTGTDAEAELQHTLAQWFEEAGLEVDLWALDLDELRADPDFPGTEAPRLEGHGLVGTAEGEGPPGLVLQGHVDVVPVGDLAKWPGAEPFSASISDGVLHGRGACDMKAGVAATLAVARALHRSGVRTERRLALHSVVSEEDGGLGAFATLRRGHGGEVAVIPEPTSGRVITANAGALTFRIDVPGRAAHGSTRLEGVSAFEAFWPLHLALRELEARRNTDVDPLVRGRLASVRHLGGDRAGR